MVLGQFCIVFAPPIPFLWDVIPTGVQLVIIFWYLLNPVKSYRAKSHKVVPV
jgi:hypothetical protein